MQSYPSQGGQQSYPSQGGQQGYAPQQQQPQQPQQPYAQPSMQRPPQDAQGAHGAPGNKNLQVALIAALVVIPGIAGIAYLARATRAEKVATCLDGYVTARTRWSTARRSITAVTEDPTSPMVRNVEAARARQQQARLAAAGCRSWEADCTPQRTAAEAADRSLEAAERALRGISTERIDRVIVDNPMRMVLAARAYENPPNNVAAAEVASARQSTEDMWRQCRNVCHDLQCSGD